MVQRGFLFLQDLKSRRASVLLSNPLSKCERLLLRVHN